MHNVIVVQVWNLLPVWSFSKPSTYYKAWQGLSQKYPWVWVACHMLLAGILLLMLLHEHNLSMQHRDVIGILHTIDEPWCLGLACCWHLSRHSWLCRLRPCLWILLPEAMLEHMTMLCFTSTCMLFPVPLISSQSCTNSCALVCTALHNATTKLVSRNIKRKQIATKPLWTQLLDVLKLPSARPKKGVQGQWACTLKCHFALPRVEAFPAKQDGLEQDQQQLPQGAPESAQPCCF